MLPSPDKQQVSIIIQRQFENISERNLEEYGGTIICASKLRWRVIDECMGQNEFYISAK